MSNSIQSSVTLTGEVQASATIIGTVAISGGGGSGESVPIYEGPYESVPSVKEQILTTKRKLMINDITIRKIPYFEVSNTSGGITASIGNLEV